MTIGPDIKEAIVEVGTKYTILRDAGNVTGETLQYKSNAQVTKPFIREFFLEAQLVYDSVVSVGDILQFTSTSTKYLVMNLTPREFESEIILYEAVLYKCNVVVSVYRPDDTGDRDDQYHQITAWSLIKADVNALLTTPLTGVDLETDYELGLLHIKEMELYIPTSIGLQALDRIKISADEYYAVDAVKPRRYTSVDVVDVSEDERPITGSSITTTTSTTSSSTTTTSSSSTTTTSSSTTTTTTTTA